MLLKIPTHSSGKLFLWFTTSEIVVVVVRPRYGDPDITTISQFRQLNFSAGVFEYDLSCRSEMQCFCPKFRKKADQCCEIACSQWMGKPQRY